MLGSKPWFILKAASKSTRHPTAFGDHLPSRGRGLRSNQNPETRIERALCPRIATHESRQTRQHCPPHPTAFGQGALDGREALWIALGSPLETFRLLAAKLPWRPLWNGSRLRSG